MRALGWVVLISTAALSTSAGVECRSSSASQPYRAANKNTRRDALPCSPDLYVCILAWFVLASPSYYCPSFEPPIAETRILRVNIFLSFAAWSNNKNNLRVVCCQFLSGIVLLLSFILF